MTAVWTELQALGASYAGAVVGFFWIFVLAVVVAAILTTWRLDRRVTAHFERGGPWPYAGAILLGLLSPF